MDGSTAFLSGINISDVYSSGSSLGHSEKPINQTSGWRDIDIRIQGPVVGEFEKLFIQTWAKHHGKPLAPKDYFPSVAPQGMEIVRAIGSGPDDDDSLIYLALISPITNAEEKVYLTNAYFVPDPQLIKALLDAEKRGVDVRQMLPSNSDSAMAFYSGRSHYADLLAGG